MDENQFFIVSWGQIENRLDPHYSLPKYRKLLDRISFLNLVKIGQSSIRIFSGMTPLSGGDAYTTPSKGIPFIRSGDFGYDGKINFSEVIYIRPDIHQKLMESSQLTKGDVLFAIVGATIGKISYYPYDRDANINQAVCGVRLKNDVKPEYLTAFFQTDIGQQLIERAKRPVARANINLEEVGDLIFPKVNNFIQIEVIKILEEGYRRGCKNFCVNGH